MDRVEMGWVPDAERMPLDNIAPVRYCSRITLCHPTFYLWRI